MKQYISSSDFCTKIEPSNSRLKSRRCDGEFLNKIEIRGIVGRAEIKSIGENKCLQMSVATNYSYKDKEGTPCIDTMWHNVTAWIGDTVSEKTALDIQKQSWVHVTGRLRAIRYTDADGQIHNTTEVIASGVELLENEQ